jgi:tripartite-type tricarboxylate transporter receptor subunit TctC
MFKTALFVSTFCFIAALPAAALADDFPNRPITFIVPFPAGGSMDTFSRPIAQKLSQTLGVPVVVSNRSGAGGGIGISAIARAKPDGYTIGMSSIGNMVINPHIYPDLTYSPLKDFTPIGLAGKFVNVLVVNAQVPAKYVQELITLAKNSPEKITFASAGNGSTNHLSGELLKLKTGASFLHVPYRGSGPALSDLIAGNVTFMFDTLNTSMPHIQAGKLRALAVTSPERSPFLPNVPTMNEAGIKDYARAGEDMWWAVVAPKNLPPKILTRLNDALRASVDSPDLQKQIAEQRLETMSSTPDELHAIFAKDYDRWGQIVRDAGIKPQ